MVLLITIVNNFIYIIIMIILPTKTALVILNDHTRTHLVNMHLSTNDNNYIQAILYLEGLANLSWGSPSIAHGQDLATAPLPFLPNSCNTPLKHAGKKLQQL